MALDLNQERAAFEAWANGRFELHLVNPAGRYSSAITQFAWEAYQAGRAALQSQASGRAAPSAETAATVNRETVIEWLDALDIEVTDKQLDGLFHAAPVAAQAQPSANAHKEN